jgi:hypothetical protein
MAAQSPNRARPLRRAVHDAEQRRGSGAALFAGVTGENSPHPTNQPEKTKIDRVLAKYFFESARMAEMPTGSAEIKTKGTLLLSAKTVRVAREGFAKFFARVGGAG